MNQTRPPLGHNGGPTMEPGQAWRRHCWTEARRELLPSLPLEVIRFRVKRAAALGLDYRSYAAIRAGTNCDIIAFLFSSNALRLVRAGDVLAADRSARLGATAADRLGLAQAPLTPAHLQAALGDIRFRLIAPAPRPHAPWGEVRENLRALLAESRLPRAGIVVIGETPSERVWSSAGQLAGFLPAERFFGGDPR